MDQLLICTDLDRTLLPNGAAPESPEARVLLRRLAGEAAVTLVFVTGRDTALVNAARRQYDLPAPDYLITDVGATVADPSGRRWQVWDAHLEKDWAGADLVKVVGESSGLILQNSKRQGRYKVSYDLPAAADLAAAASNLSRQLQDAGLAATVVSSRDDVSGQGLIDVLPRRAGKAPAIEFLRRRLGFAPEQTICAGDSGNDLDFLIGPLPAVLVANATAEVRAAARTGAARAGHTAQLHLARGGVLGLNGNYAAGVIEGVLHFQPSWAQLFEDCK